MKVSPRGLVSIRRKRKVKPCERIEKTGRKIYNFGLSPFVGKEGRRGCMGVGGGEGGSGVGVGGGAEVNMKSK